jgi:hypothetical protein
MSGEQDQWGACGRRVRKSLVPGTSFVEVLEYMIESNRAEEIELHAEVARKLWFRRNAVVHGGDFIDPNAVILSTHAAIKWRPPIQGTLKIN